ncbi:MAG TPA: insulinase family protein, partial [Saprospiraceae bacterium]|nr:insulinase family protein [Saprospiraceae bacterium]
GESSRLYRALVDEQQKALFVGNFPLGLEDPGVSIAFGISKMGVDILDLEKAMDAEVAKVQNELITDEEFQKLKNQVENDFISGNSRVAGIAESLANYKMYFGDTNLINTELDRYLKVTKEDIRRAANTYFNKNNRVTLHYLPKNVTP